jgi:hypothetical protein
MKRFLYTVFAALIVAATVGCASMSLDEQLATAELQVNGMVRSVAAARQDQTIPQADGLKFASYARQATDAIHAARDAERSGDLTTAQGKLAVVTSLLSKLSAYLVENNIK